ncbi:MAG TPA: hypothetical protein VIG64_08620 [Actinomycetota bacterium]|jgi:hypothetical protein
MIRRTLSLVLVLMLAVMIQPASAGKKKPKVKPYKSEEGTIAVAHPVFYDATGTVNSVTAREFESTCAVPASNGVDAYVFEVPAAYQSITASVKAVGVEKTPGSYDLDVFMYDKDCAVKGVSNGEGTDETGVMPAGVAWILVGSYLGEPAVSVHIELAPYTPPTF